jgi:hypothetical protein
MSAWLDAQLILAEKDQTLERILAENPLDLQSFLLEASEHKDKNLRELVQPFCKALVAARRALPSVGFDSMDGIDSVAKQVVEVDATTAVELKTVRKQLVDNIHQFKELGNSISRAIQSIKSRKTAIGKREKTKEEHEKEVKSRRWRKRHYNARETERQGRVARGKSHQKAQDRFGSGGGKPGCILRSLSGLRFGLQVSHCHQGD